MKSYFILLFSLPFLAVSQTGIQQKTIFFDSNSYQLNDSDKKELTSLFSNENTYNSTVSVFGFCDDVGTEKANELLSIQRAKTVSVFLNDNFKIHLDSIKGKGEIALSENEKNIQFARKNNRKVVISYSSLLPKKSEETNKSNLPSSEYKTLDDKLYVGDKIIINNILFLGNLTTFQDDEVAENELKKIVLFLQKNPNISIEIRGHVCCIPDYMKDSLDITTGKSNLSEARAERIYDYFISNEISENRMTFAGYGRQFPLPNNTNELNNKRVEIMITKI